MCIITKKIFFFVILAGLFFVACNKGPKDGVISPVNEISFSGLNDTFEVNLGDTLSISPVLSFTKDSKNYSYEWILTSDGGVTLDTILLATSRDLNAVISKTLPGLHLAYYRVKDIASGVVWSESFYIDINTAVAKGWMVLSEVNGGSRLDMISLSGSTYTPVYDVLGFMKSSLQLSGAPVNVTCMNPFYESSDYVILISTQGNGSVLIDPETFDWTTTDRLSYRMPAPGIPTDFLADGFLPTIPAIWAFGSSLVFKAGDVYSGSTSSALYGLPINYINGTRFQASPSMTRYYLYDVANRRFIATGNPSCSTISPTLSVLFDYNNTGMDLVYMTQTYYNNTSGFNNGGETWAILKDPNSLQYFLARMDHRTYTQLYYKAMNAINIDQAAYFAVSPDYGFLFYTVGSKIYKYDFSQDQSFLMQDYGTRVITHFDCQPFFINGTGQPLDEQRKLIVGTYDPTLPEGSNGSLDFYTIGPVNTPLTLQSSYSGFGKIQSVAYRQRP